MGFRIWVVAWVEWVWVLGIIGVTVTGCVHGSNALDRILSGMVTYQAGSQGHQNLTPLQAQGIALFHPEMGPQQLFMMSLTSCPHPQGLGYWGWKLQIQFQQIWLQAGLENGGRVI